MLSKPFRRWPLSWEAAWENEAALKNIALSRRLKAIPGGLLLFPMLCGMILRLLPDLSDVIGNPFSTLFSSKATMYIVGLLLFFSGAQCRPRDIWTGIRRDGPLLLLKLLLNAGIILFFSKFCKNFSLFGISLIAVAACVYSCNPGLFLGLTTQYGTPADRTCFALLNIISLPGIAVCLFRLTSGFSFAAAPVLGGILPFVLGVLAGVLIPALQCSDTVKLLLPFLGLSLGCAIDISTLGSQLLPGLLLSLLYLLTNTLPLMLTERFALHRSGLTSAAACSIAGVSLSVPALIAATEPQWSAAVPDAAAQLAVALLLTNIAAAFFAKNAAEKKS